ncbi:MAG: hypothetical protein IPM29_28855 [Planctomycetes bacterium]|nr:hypothetical protein [Planctomycetota bacterium]
MLETLLLAVAVYLALGLAFAVPFVIAGAARIDPAARAATVGFRLAIVAGVAVFWPLLLRRWLRPVDVIESNAHRRASR